jgi:hypothetical protein
MERTLNLISTQPTVPITAQKTPRSSQHPSILHGRKGPQLLKLISTFFKQRQQEPPKHKHTQRQMECDKSSRAHRERRTKRADKPQTKAATVATGAIDATSVEIGRDIIADPDPDPDTDLDSRAAQLESESEEKARKEISQLRRRLDETAHKHMHNSPIRNATGQALNGTTQSTSAQLMALASVIVCKSDSIRNDFAMARRAAASRTASKQGAPLTEQQIYKECLKRLLLLKAVARTMFGLLVKSAKVPASFTRSLEKPSTQTSSRPCVSGSSTTKATPPFKTNSSSHPSLLSHPAN